MLALQEEFDLEVALKQDEPEMEFYQFIITDGLPSDGVVKILRKYENDTKHNAKPKVVKKREIRDLNKVMLAASERPKDPVTQAFSDMDFKLEILTSFINGEIKLIELLDDLKEHSGAAIDLKVLNSDLERLRKSSACVGMANLMLNERGEDVDMPKRTCLGCSVISSCAVVTFASTPEVGVRAGLSGVERKDIISSAGATVVRKMLSDTSTPLFRNALGEIFKEYQEVIDPEGFGTKISTKRGPSQPAAHNRRTLDQLELAITELANLYTIQ